MLAVARINQDARYLPWYIVQIKHKHERIVQVQVDIYFYSLSKLHLKCRNDLYAMLQSHEVEKNQNALDHSTTSSISSYMSHSLIVRGSLPLISFGKEYLEASVPRRLEFGAVIVLAISLASPESENIISPGVVGAIEDDSPIGDRVEDRSDDG